MGQGLTRNVHVNIGGALVTEDQLLEIVGDTVSKYVN